MDMFKQIWKLLAGGESFVVAAIVSRSGSAPRAVGTRMIVCGDGSTIGTIGGGILEAQVRELGRRVFIERKVVLSRFVLTAEDAGRMGMVCGGQIEVLLHLVDASNVAQLQLYREIVSLSDARESSWLITELPSGEDVREAPRQHLSGSGPAPAGGMSDAAVQALAGQLHSRQAEVLVHGGSRYLVERLCHKGTVYIFGAGHISQVLAPLAGLVGFETIVLDDRAEFASRERFETVGRIIVLESFETATEGVDINGDSYVVLVTRGHAHDKTVLGKVLRTGAAYIGMIGSRRKRDAIYEALQREGFSRTELDRVHSPIGLDIGAETPEEIAVSIVSELIQVRAGRNGWEGSAR